MKGGSHLTGVGGGLPLLIRDIPLQEEGRLAGGLGKGGRVMVRTEVVRGRIGAVRVTTARLSRGGWLIRDWRGSIRSKLRNKLI